MTTPHCIPIFDLVSFHWKLMKSMLYAHKATRWNKNATLRNKNSKSVFYIIRKFFIQGFNWSPVCIEGGGVDWWYLGQLLCQLFSLPTPQPSTHPDIVTDNKKWRLQNHDKRHVRLLQGQTRTLSDPIFWRK